VLSQTVLDKRVARTLPGHAGIHAIALTLLRAPDTARDSLKQDSMITSRSRSPERRYTKRWSLLSRWNGP